MQNVGQNIGVNIGENIGENIANPLIHSMFHDHAVQTCRTIRVRPSKRNSKRLKSEGTLSNSLHSACNVLIVVVVWLLSLPLMGC